MEKWENWTIADLSTLTIEIRLEHANRTAVEHPPAANRNDILEAFQHQSKWQAGHWWQSMEREAGHTATDSGDGWQAIQATEGG
jgi:hypothetical protein